MAQRYLAYHDTFTGLVPCRICTVGDWSNRYSLARVQYTATRGAYKRGEYATVVLSQLVPRHAVYRSRQHCGQYRIRPYTWAIEARP